MLKKIFIFAVFIALISSIFYFSNNSQGFFNQDNNENKETVEVQREPQDNKKLVEITAGSTFGELMTEAGISPSLSNAIYDQAFDSYDLATVKAGHFFELFFDPATDEFKKLVYKIDSEDELIVTYQNNEVEVASSSEDSLFNLIVEVKPIDYEVKIVTKEGEVKTSMYVAALENDIDERAIIEFANAFQWTIDFAMDPRVGDTFKFVYEERYLDGEYQMPGKVLAGQYINAGTKYQVYYFEETENNIGYFDENGNSVQKMFLKAPVAFRYISSGYTTGARYLEAFDIYTGHRAIDYAADYGAPIQAVGDGTVIMATYNGSYGNMVQIRHNGTYQTNYGHMSKFAVSKGDKVKQGDIIGYVGSTGLSTGPHVHFEMVKNGVKINPLTEILPPGEAIASENQDRFFNEIAKWQEMLGE